jgi:two-component system chemotaxis sensor kinase CheA
VEEVALGRIQRANQREYLDFRGSVIPLVRLEQALNTLPASYDSDLLYVIIPKSRKPFGIVAAHIRDTVELSDEVDSETVTRPGVFASVMIDSRLTLFIDFFEVIRRIEPDWWGPNRLQVGGNRKVLLVEDSGFHAAQIANFLRGAGLQVVRVVNGEEGLKRLSEETFDAVVSDIEMPVMDGFEFAERVRSGRKNRDVPLMAISSMRDEAVLPRALRSGFDRFESKLEPQRMLHNLVRFCGGDATGVEGGTP